jgi:hypothetical protein
LRKQFNNLQLELTTDMATLVRKVVHYLNHPTLTNMLGTIWYRWVIVLLARDEKIN